MFSIVNFDGTKLGRVNSNNIPCIDSDIILHDSNEYKEKSYRVVAISYNYETLDENNNYGIGEDITITVVRNI